MWFVTVSVDVIVYIDLVCQPCIDPVHRYCHMQIVQSASLPIWGLTSKSSVTHHHLPQSYSYNNFPGLYPVPNYDWKRGSADFLFPGFLFMRLINWSHLSIVYWHVSKPGGSENQLNCIFQQSPWAHPGNAALWQVSFCFRILFQMITNAVTSRWG